MKSLKVTIVIFYGADMICYYGVDSISTMLILEC